MSSRAPNPTSEGPTMPVALRAPVLYPPNPLPDRRAEYEALIGPRQSPYYVPRFEALDRQEAGGRWNGWAALFTQGWMVFRGLYLWGLVLYPLLSLLVLLGCSSLWSGVLRDASHPWVAPAAICLAWLVAPGLFGNRLFHRRAVNVIEKSRRLQPMPGAGPGGLDAETARRDWLMRQGVPGWAAVLLLLPFLFFEVLGIGEAIAVPAYSDYTVRAKVAGAMTHARAVKTGYDAYVARRGLPPATMADLNLPETSALYGPNVASIRIGPDHAILITLAGEPRIADKTLVFVPTMPGATPPWACHVGTLPSRYAPTLCRS